MHRLILATVVLACSGAATAEKSVKGTGFTCTSAAGQVKRINIDLKRGRYDAGAGVERLERVTDTKITIKGPNRFAVAGGPIGPIISSLELDRSSLVLTDQMLVPERNINRTTNYQCVMGSTIDFAAGRQF